MGLFSRHKYKTLSQAILAGDLRATRKMLDQGVALNRCDPCYPNDDSYPIHHALHRGPEIVQLLVDYGADVNIATQGAMPLAIAEARGYTEVAQILRRAGARVRADNDKYYIDPRVRFKIEPWIWVLVRDARINSPKASPERIADQIEGEISLENLFSKDMSPQEQKRIRKDLRALIVKECKVKNDLSA